MNIQAIIISDLRKKREKAVTELAKIDAVISLYNLTASVAGPVKRTRKRRRSQAQIDAIKKAQDARKAKFEAKKAEEAATAPASRESHPRLPVGLGKGANLAAAAE